MTSPPVEPIKIAVGDASEVAVARDAVMSLARRVGLTDARADVAALVTTELAQNLHLHAVGGELVITPPPPVGPGRFAVIAVDRGPGVRNFERCLVDGYSTRGTMGTGLGAARRLADEFDGVSEPGRGTTVRAAFDVAPTTTQDPDPAGFVVDGVGFPVEHESVNGDSWTCVRTGDRITVLLADGLGHGPGAAEASRGAVEAFLPRADRPPAEVMQAVSDQIASTRGAAVTLATLDVSAALRGGSVTTSGLGNVSIAVVDPSGTTRRLATAHGTAGSSRGIRAREQVHAFPAGGLLVLHTDGLTSRWTLDGRAELLRHHPGVIAATLWRDHLRGRDDSFVVVLKGVAGR